MGNEKDAARWRARAEKAEQHAEGLVSLYRVDTGRLTRRAEEAEELVNTYASSLNAAYARVEQLTKEGNEARELLAIERRENAT